MADPNQWPQAMFDSAPPKLEGMTLEALERFYHYFSEVDQQISRPSELRLNAERMALLRSHIERLKLQAKIEAQNELLELKSQARHRDAMSLGRGSLRFQKLIGRAGQRMNCWILSTSIAAVLVALGSLWFSYRASKRPPIPPPATATPSATTTPLPSPTPEPSLAPSATPETASSTSPLPSQRPKEESPASTPTPLPTGSRESLFEFRVLSAPQIFVCDSDDIF